ncbi:MAG TPA: AI-2E family transporter [Spongiibacteraceae bacterium]|nr:AI-2E family transporter [Spongiibacteraceae bacterium]
MQAKFAQSSFIILLMAITALFGWILQPLFGAVLWAAVVTVIFHPLQARWAPRFGQRKNLLAFTVLVLCTLMVILPLLVVAFSLAREGASFYKRVQSGELNIGARIDAAKSQFPALQDLLQRVGIDISDLQQRLTDAAAETGHFLTTQAFTFGQNTAQFLVSLVLMLYLTFFFLRDGEQLLMLFMRALPLGENRERLLLRKINEVTNATVKGNLAVAAVQGALGAFIFWALDVESALLWGVVMFFTSLLPSVGSALVWGR